MKTEQEDVVMTVKTEKEDVVMEVPPAVESNGETTATSNPEENEAQQGQKRPASEEPKKERKKRKSMAANQNPLMQLNELMPGLPFHLESQDGPNHIPVFCFSVQVNGQKFYGKGNSKRKAKHEVAKAALSSFVHFEGVPIGAHTIMCGTNDQDFSSEKEEFVKNGNGAPKVNSKTPPNKRKKCLEEVLSNPDKKNPVMMLNAVEPGLTFTLEKENSENPNQRFVMSVKYKEEVFKGCGPSKKSAKAAAARAILVQQFNVNFNTACTPSANIAEDDVFCFPQHVADKIGQRVFETFSEVMTKIPQYAKWKVLAGIVMSEGEDMNDLKVITLSTGTKNLNGEYMSMTGSVLNDCHAEIISRRCLKEYFYTQLELYFDGKEEESIFELTQNDKFVVKPNIRFHLFISTSPCGDARVFSVHDGDIGQIDRHPNRKARGLLRTKIESGEGTIPIKPGEEIQTWDGIIQGQQRYLTMSCSDKVASWNVLGVQGSLLSHFLEPIYLYSIVLGGLFHRDHMRRAVFGRMDNLVDLPSPYQVHKPKMCATTNRDSRELTTSPNFCVNWTIGINEPEVVTTRVGKTVQAQASRISKQSLFQRFAHVYPLLYGNSDIIENTYAECKNLVKDYKKAKELMNAAFIASKLGTWVAKPAEQDLFTLSL